MRNAGLWLVLALVLFNSFTVLAESGGKPSEHESGTAGTKTDKTDKEKTSPSDSSIPAPEKDEQKVAKQVVKKELEPLSEEVLKGFLDKIEAKEKLFTTEKSGAAKLSREDVEKILGELKLDKDATQDNKLKEAIKQVLKDQWKKMGEDPVKTLKILILELMKEKNSKKDDDKKGEKSPDKGAEDAVKKMQEELDKLKKSFEEATKNAAKGDDKNDLSKLLDGLAKGQQDPNKGEGAGAGSGSGAGGGQGGGKGGGEGSGTPTGDQGNQGKPSASDALKSLGDRDRDRDRFNKDSKSAAKAPEFPSVDKIPKSEKKEEKSLAEAPLNTSKEKTEADASATANEETPKGDSTTLDPLQPKKSGLSLGTNFTGLTSMPIAASSATAPTEFTGSTSSSLGTQLSVPMAPSVPAGDPQISAPVTKMGGSPMGFNYARTNIYSGTGGTGESYSGFSEGSDSYDSGTTQSYSGNSSVPSISNRVYRSSASTTAPNIFERNAIKSFCSTVKVDVGICRAVRRE